MMRLKDWGVGWKIGGFGGDSRSNFVSWEKSSLFIQQEVEVQAKVR